jgi:L-aminopeptidase/D-esterase-like protein
MAPRHSVTASLPGTKRCTSQGAYAEPVDSFADIAGLLVGHWTDRESATGCTVVLGPPQGFAAAVSVRGGAPGTRETDVLRPGNLVQRIHGVLLTGGSAFGLDAAAGIMRYLEEARIGFETRGGRVPIVVGAVLYDLSVGRADVRPGAEQGYAACLSGLSEDSAQGSVGAGTGATVAKAGGIDRAIKGGIGSASERLHDGTLVAALVAVNAFGDVRDIETGELIAHPRADAAGRRETAIELLRRRGSRREESFMNTTLAIVATSAGLSRDQLIRVAEMGHGGIARAIEPSHTPADGDIVFAIATGEDDERTSKYDVSAIGALGSRAVSRAIARAVRFADGLAGIPSAADLAGSSTTAPNP